MLSSYSEQSLMKQINDAKNIRNLGLVSDYQNDVILERSIEMKKITKDVKVLRKLSEDLSILVDEQDHPIKNLNKKTDDIQKNTKGALNEVIISEKAGDQCCSLCSIW